MSLIFLQQWDSQNSFFGFKSDLKFYMEENHNYSKRKCTEIDIIKNLAFVSTTFLMICKSLMFQHSLLKRSQKQTDENHFPNPLLTIGFIIINILSLINPHFNEWLYFIYPFESEIKINCTTKTRKFPRDTQKTTLHQN